MCVWVCVCICARAYRFGGGGAACACRFACAFARVRARVCVCVCVCVRACLTLMVQDNLRLNRRYTSLSTVVVIWYTNKCKSKIMISRTTS